MKRRKSRQTLKAFLPDDQIIITIIDICDLYPIDNSWKKWTDHLGNYLTVHNNKKVITFSQNPLENSELIVTDLYFKTHPKIISKISKWAFVSFAKDQTNAFNTLYIWFLGRDNRLRFCTFHNNKWISNNSPLICGIDTLRPILDNLNVKDFCKSDILHIKGPIAVDITRSWSSQWPPKKELTIEMNKYNEKLTKEVMRIL